MSEWPARFQVAQWEFQRFVKPNQLVISFVIMLMMGALGYGVSRVARRADTKPRQVAVVNGAALGLDRSHSIGNLSFVPAGPSQLDSLRGALGARDLDGILILSGADSATLVVRRNPPWKMSLETHLAAARQRLRLAETGIAPGQLTAILAPVAVTTEFQSGSDGRGARLAAFVAIGVVLYGVFTSMAYMLVSVTAEKQLRVTEQVVSAISPQTWIDGKILGIASVAVVNVLIFLGGAIVWVLGRSIATGSRFSMGSAEPGAVALIVIFATLGFLFWLSLFGAVAATIDDPNSSTRGPLMFVPALFSLPAFAIVANPDSTFARIAGLIPLTSSAVMPARVALTEVPVWELIVSAILLAGATLVARRLAGKIFSVAMLMYGKEPGWGEIRRWLRDS